MPFIDTKTLAEDKDRFLKLRNKFLELNTKYGYPDHDGRVILLNNICNLIMSAIMNMSLLISLDKKIIKEEQVRRLLSVDTGNFHGSMMAENDLRRVVYITIFQFQIETLFKVLLTGLGEIPSKNYYNIIKQILTRLNLSNFSQKKDTLNILAYMRNCMHSNGVHTKPSKDFILDNYTFKFQQGESFNQAKWAHLHYVSDNVVEILEDVLDSTEIQAIAPPLPFRFSVI